jgi:hypothetical protein
MKRFGASDGARGIDPNRVLVINDRDIRSESGLEPACRRENDKPPLVVRRARTRGVSRRVRATENDPFRSEGESRGAVECSSFARQRSEQQTADEAFAAET